MSFSTMHCVVNTPTMTSLGVSTTQSGQRTCGGPRSITWRNSFVNGRRVGHSTASVSCSASLYAKAQGKGLNRRGRKTLVTQMGLFGLGAPEIAVIAGVVALIYGPSKLPQLGKGLGKTFKSFQTAAKEFEKELKEEMSDDDKKEEEAKKELPPPSENKN